MSNFPMTITGYTSSSHLGDYYKRAVRRLFVSCTQLDITLLAYALKPVTDWITGCSLKVPVIIETIERYQRPVLWVDADGEIFKYPSELANITSGIALCSVQGHWLSGTFLACPDALPFLREWQKVAVPPAPDEVALLHLYRSSSDRPKLHMLPDNYNVVVHNTTDLSDVVIGHHIRPDVAPSRGVIPTQLNY